MTDSNNRQPAQPQEPAFEIDRVRYVLENVPFDRIAVQAEDFSFRDDEELSIPESATLKALAEDIKAFGNLHTPLLLKKTAGGRYLLADGHRRYTALQELIEGRVEGFARDMLVPANVLGEETGELAMVARAISANVQRQAPSALGRMRGAVRLHRLGMPVADIGRLYGVSVATVERDLAVGSDEKMMEHVREHHITATGAAALVKLAKDKDRLAEFHEEFDRWLSRTLTEIDEEQGERLAADMDPLPPEQTWPQRRLTTEQVKEWKLSLQQGRPFVEPTFRFKAGVFDNNGRKRIEMDSLSRDLSQMTTEELTKLFARLYDMSMEIEYALRHKVAYEEAMASSTLEEPLLTARERLEEIGLGEIAHFLPIDVESEPYEEKEEDYEEEEDGGATAPNVVAVAEPIEASTEGGALAPPTQLRPIPQGVPARKLMTIAPPLAGQPNPPAAPRSAK